MDKICYGILIGIAIPFVAVLEANAGRLPEPGEARGELLPGETQSKASTFQAKVFASVTVTGHSPGGDIDCYVIKDGSIIDTDADDSNRCMLSWIPPEKGVYTIRIVNNGKTKTSFYLETN